MVNAGTIDLTERHGSARGEFALGFNRFMEATHAGISDAKRAALSLAGATEHLSQAAQEAQRGANEQAARIDEVSSAVSEMAASACASSPRVRRSLLGRFRR
jgi:methyl-accepting chemotaxis protein